MSSNPTVVDDWGKASGLNRAHIRVSISQFQPYEHSEASATDVCFIPVVRVESSRTPEASLPKTPGARWMFDSILCEVTEYDPEVLEPLIGLAVEIAREGREGRRVGTLFTLGDEKAVLAKSRPLILDPLFGHPESSRHITNLNLRGTIKELAQLDGGFVVSRDGIVLSACRYLDAAAALGDVPLGLGRRHIAAP